MPCSGVLRSPATTRSTGHASGAGSRGHSSILRARCAALSSRTGQLYRRCDEAPRADVRSPGQEWMHLVRGSWDVQQPAGQGSGGPIRRLSSLKCQAVPTLPSALRTSCCTAAATRPKGGQRRPDRCSPPVASGFLACLSTKKDRGKMAYSLLTPSLGGKDATNDGRNSPFCGPSPAHFRWPIICLLAF